MLTPTRLAGRESRAVGFAPDEVEGTLVVPLVHRLCKVALVTHRDEGMTKNEGGERESGREGERERGTTNQVIYLDLFTEAPTHQRRL